MAEPSGDGQYGQYAQADPSQGFQQGAPQPEVATAAGKKKKRGYAAGAFDVGSGANAAAGGQLQGGGQQFAGAPTPAYGGYPQPDQQQPQPPQPGAQGYPQYGQGYDAQQQPPAQQPGYGGYPAPDQGYPAPAGPTGAAQGVAGITQGMGTMQMGGQPGPQPQPYQQQPQLAGPQGPTAPHMNRGPLAQLYPTDLMNQPFNVSELDLP